MVPRLPVRRSETPALRRQARDQLGDASVTELVQRSAYVRFIAALQRTSHFSWRDSRVGVGTRQHLGNRELQRAQAGVLDAAGDVSWWMFENVRELRGRTAQGPHELRDGSIVSSKHICIICIVLTDCIEN